VNNNRLLFEANKVIENFIHRNKNKKKYSIYRNTVLQYMISGTCLLMILSFLVAVFYFISWLNY
jgi:hypothetical protein